MEASLLLHVGRVVEGMTWCGIDLGIDIRTSQCTNVRWQSSDCRACLLAISESDDVGRGNRGDALFALQRLG